MKNKLLKIAALSSAVLVAPMAQAHHHHHGFWGGFTGGLIGGFFGPRIYAMPAYSYPVYTTYSVAPVVVQQPVIQQPVVQQQPVYVNQAPVQQQQAQQPVFLNQAPAQTAQQQALPDLKPGETLVYEVKPDGTKSYKITRQEVPAPQQDAARVREN